MLCIKRTRIELFQNCGDALQAEVETIIRLLQIINDEKGGCSTGSSKYLALNLHLCLVDFKRITYLRSFCQVVSEEDNNNTNNNNNNNNYYYYYYREHFYKFRAYTNCSKSFTILNLCFQCQQIGKEKKNDKINK